MSTSILAEYTLGFYYAKILAYKLPDIDPIMLRNTPIMLKVAAIMLKVLILALFLSSLCTSIQKKEHDISYLCLYWSITEVSSYVV